MRDWISFVEPFLPEEVEKPMLFKFSSSAMPILFYGVTADESFEAIANILDEKVVNQLNRIDGVGSVGLMGAPGREIQVDIDPRKMEADNSVTLDSWYLWGATAGISSDDWTAELYVENLTDERAEVSGNAIFNRARVTLARPRTAGLRFTYDF